MRVLTVLFLVLYSFACIGCAVHLQPSQQGEWSDVHDEKDQVTKDARPSGEKKPEAK